jgi:hypothetical protein
MLNDLNDSLRSEVASHWPEIAFFARRQGDFSWNRGAAGTGFIMLPDPDAKAEYVDHILSRSDSNHFVHAHSMRDGPRLGDDPGEPQQGVVWFDALPKTEEYYDVADAESLDVEFEAIEEAGRKERDAFIEAYGRLEWAAHCTAPEDGGVVVALQIGPNLVWDVFREVAGLGLLEAADSYDGPTDPGTQLGDENLLMN